MASIGLGREATGAGAEEGKVPVQQVEEHGAHGDAADKGRTGIAFHPSQMPHHGHVHHSHQGNGDVRQDAGHRKAQDFPVERAV